MKKTSGFIFLILVWSLTWVEILPAQTAKKQLSVEDIVNAYGKLILPGASRMAWRPGSASVSYVKMTGSGKAVRAGLYEYHVPSGAEHVLLTATPGKPGPGLLTYQWSPKGDAILFTGDNDLWLLDVSSGKVSRLTNDSDPEEDPTFSPQGDRVAFVKHNNIYVLDIKTGHSQAVTQDGTPDVLNGKMDWVYQEEIANRTTGRSYAWSPDGAKIAYLQLDDRPVPRYPITDYLQVHAGLIWQRFPQAGDANPVASFHVVKVDGQVSHAVTFPLPSAAEYVDPAFAWAPDSKHLAFLTLNRHQTHLVLHYWNPQSGSDRVLLTETDRYWINSLEPPQFIAGGKQFLWLSERDGWLHLYRYASHGHLLNELGSGKWMIDIPIFQNVATVQVDQKQGWVYFISTEKDVGERHIYRVRLDGTGLARITGAAGVHGLDLSPDGQYILDSFSNVDTPPETLLLRSDGTPMKTLTQMTSHINEYNLAPTQFLKIKAHDGATLYARMVKPVNFDPHKKYPVLIDVYGGPHVQLVQNRFGETSLLDEYLAERGVIIWSLDNRGSWGRGHAWETPIFEDMGPHELDDQLAGVDYLKSLPYVNASRIGIFGWSYGGYMTLYSLTHAPNVFKCGIAGAPVTDWKFYDSIYTERYMRTPQENPEGYKTSSPLEAASHLRAKLLLIHGTSDDNVHMQNSMQFDEALIKAGIPFDLYIQPGQKHGFREKDSRMYLEKRLVQFIQANL
ncbi:MAG: S9 family peptidase [Terriglobia bacterium]